MTSWILDQERLQTVAYTYDPTIKLYTKDNILMSICAWCLFLITFGGSKRESFLQRYATTMGHAHFYPKEWSAREVEQIWVHEAQHTKQFRKLAFGLHPIFGWPGILLLQLLSPLPIGLCYGRYWMEVDANKAFWRHAIKHWHWGSVSVYNHARHKAENISSASYFWAWPRSWAYKGYQKAAEEVLNE